LTFDTALGQETEEARKRQTGVESPSLACSSNALPMPTTATTSRILCPTKTKVIFIILTGKQITSSLTQTHTEGKTTNAGKETLTFWRSPFRGLLLASGFRLPFRSQLGVVSRLAHQRQLKPPFRPPSNAAQPHACPIKYPFKKGRD